ncbi:MAG: ATP-binding cassette domain-containing protein [Chitinivibrionales bacterium]|nr:ATP-binding cassette domain-containing protein [Chitinivibrionales bacterium]
MGETAENTNTILEIENLKVSFPVFGGIFQRRVAEVKAVDGVSFSIRKGEIFGLVGESGSGKSTIGKAIINVLWVTAPFVRCSGRISLYLDNKKIDLLSLPRSETHVYRKHIQMIFQDPYSSLNPRMLVKDIIREPLDINRPELSNKEKSETVDLLLSKVGLSAEQALRYPHEFSGGQRQRIGIARSLATNPGLIIADEPVSALDVSIQAQVINLLQDLQQEFNLSCIFIAHDLSVVEHIADRIGVLYCGTLVEIGDSDTVYRNPKHPYTQSLLSSIPLPDPKHKANKRQILEGEIPSPIAKPSGCVFHTRCPIAKPQCSTTAPEYRDFGDGHQAACPYTE